MRKGKPLVGVIGCGHVGGAVAEGFSHAVEVTTYDRLSYKCTSKSIEELVRNVSGPVFVCVPTPMKEGGIDLSHVRQVLIEISYAQTTDSDYAIVIKSTVPPGTCHELSHEFPKLKIVYNPEFLTERTAAFDFANQKRVILGGPKDDDLANLYRRRFPDIEILYTDHTTAEMIKYLNNTFFATKITFANMIHGLCEKLRVDYDTVIHFATCNDERLGKTHWNVPGPDGKFGFGGACLPKEVVGMTRLLGGFDLYPSLMETVFGLNLLYRGGADWIELKGRAVSE